MGRLIAREICRRQDVKAGMPEPTRNRHLWRPGPLGGLLPHVERGVVEQERYFLGVVKGNAAWPGLLYLRRLDTQGEVQSNIAAAAESSNRDSTGVEGDVLDTQGLCILYYAGAERLIGM